MIFQPAIYILTNKPRGVLYIGVTSDLMKRIYQHRIGMMKGFSRRYNLTQLVHYELFGTMEWAITREKQLKSWHRDWKIALIAETNPKWRDLAEDLGFEALR